MNSKRLLHFYFNADGLEHSLDNLINNCAQSSFNAQSCEMCAQRVIDLICEKNDLSLLWEFLDGVIAKFTKGEVAYLKQYANMRCGTSKLDEDLRKTIKRTLVKFGRRISGKIEKYSKTLVVIDKYYCLI